MTLLALVLIPFGAGLAAWLVSKRNSALGRYVSLTGLVANLVLVAAVLMGPSSTSTPWLAELNAPWVPQLGISFHLAADGLSMLLVGLTAIVGMAAVIASYSPMPNGATRQGFFQFNLMATLGGITGVFLAMDLFLFYFFWELMLVPMYLLFLWGGEHKRAAANKFFIFTQAGGLLMLLAILGLYVVHGQNTGSYTFDYVALLGSGVNGSLAMVLMLGFFAGFAVKLPVFPFHTWLPNAYAESPTAATVVLAGLMAKTAGYGLIRFVFPLFPSAAHAFAPVAMALAVMSILYGALLAFGQTDLKRLIAYSSLSHMGFVVLGVFAWNTMALQGAVMQMIAHGISIAALFILAGQLQARFGSRELTDMGGLWSSAPRLSALLLFFAVATLGLPGLGNFLAEFLILLGTFRASIFFAAIAAGGIVLSAVYALWLIQRTLHGMEQRAARGGDISGLQTALLGVLVAAIVWLGLAPQAVLSTATAAIDNLQRVSVERAEAAQTGTVGQEPMTGQERR